MKRAARLAICYTRVSLLAYRGTAVSTYPQVPGLQCLLDSQYRFHICYRWMLALILDIVVPDTKCYPDLEHEMSRPSYEESIRLLRERGVLGPADAPTLPPRMPLPDEDPVGLEYFRTALQGEDLSGLSLPRTFFCRSEVAETSFHDSDLTESFMCWTDFIEVDFSSALLVRADLRASSFERVSFADADLSGADLRRSSFSGCKFKGARLAGSSQR